MKTPQIAPLAGMTPLGLPPVQRVTTDGARFTFSPEYLAQQGGAIVGQPATERDTLAGQDVDQALVPGVAPLSESARQIAELLAKRRPPAGFGRLYQGGLFDDVERAQTDLFDTPPVS